MGKRLAITGLIFSLVLPFIILFMNVISIGGYLVLYLIAPVGLPSTIIGFIINLVVLIKKLDGKKFAIIGLSFNIVIILLVLVRNIFSLIMQT